MKLKIIIFLAIILTSCETTNKKVITNKDFKNYSNDGGKGASQEMGKA